MAPPDWPRFAAAVALLTLSLLALSRATAGAISTTDPTAAGEDRVSTASDSPDRLPALDRADSARPSLPSGVALLANVALTHGLLAAILVAMIWYTGVPAAALGVTAPTAGGVALGLGLGTGLYLASEATSAALDRLGVEHDERLRALLAPESAIEWLLLLLVILPIVAVAEELLFRAVIVGALGVGFGLHPAVLVIGSSLLFGLGHSAQGTVGVAVTAALGLVLGAAFVWSGSLVVVAVGHYVVDALEFVVREGLLDGDG